MLWEEGAEEEEGQEEEEDAEGEGGEEVDFSLNLTTPHQTGGEQKRQARAELAPFFFFWFSSRPLLLLSQFTYHYITLHVLTLHNIA